MSDLDTDLRALRDELNAAIPLPDVEHVTGRARTRRRLQLVAIAAVIAVAIAVPVLRLLPGDPPQVGNPPPPPVSNVLSMDFADADHGYALTRDCPRPGDPCTFDLFRTTNGGRDWQRTNLPAPLHPQTGYFAATLFVVGPDEVLIYRPNGLDSDRILSTDGGRSWETQKQWWTDNASPAPLPSHGILTGLCLSQHRSLDNCGAIGAHQPVSGKFAPAPTQPPLTYMQLGTTATKDGKWWVAGRDRTTGRWTLAMSADQGRTWMTSDLNLAEAPSLDSFAVVEGNGIMYATVRDYRGLLGVWRSVDDGRTWTRTWTHGDQRLPAPTDTPIAAGDGSLIVSDGKVTYVSIDQGSTFRPAETKVTGKVTWTRAGYLKSNGTRYALSADGLTWREFTVR
jgi:photosystem II stability/assembly factor-like uncharacterized protein